MEAIKDKLRKIQKLATDGVPGERENAQRLFQTLLTKHGLTEQDLAPSQQVDLKAMYNQMLQNLYAQLRNVAPAIPVRTWRVGECARVKYGFERRDIYITKVTATRIYWTRWEWLPTFAESDTVLQFARRNPEYLGIGKKPLWRRLMQTPLGMGLVHPYAKP